MRKSKRKVREPKESESVYKVSYESFVDGEKYWTLINARNEIEVEDLFNNKYYTEKSKIIEIEVQ